ncbi:MAG: hypothetical protein ABFD02_05605, partial [Bacteroidales bacterium]
MSVKDITGVAGNGLTVTASDEDVPLPHELVPFTVTLPETDEELKSTVMLLVELVPVTPVGSVQVY